MAVFDIIRSTSRILIEQSADPVAARRPETNVMLLYSYLNTSATQVIVTVATGNVNLRYTLAVELTPYCWYAVNENLHFGKNLCNGSNILRNECTTRF